MARDLNRIVEQRFLEERRQRANECIAYLGEERRKLERRNAARVVNWMARYDAARGALNA